GCFKSSMNRIASPVDFISGPNCLSTSGNLLNENTGSLMAQLSSFFSTWTSFILTSSSITLVAILMNGTSYALAINGTVLDALGFASMTYTSSSLIANCIFNNPFTLSAFAIFMEYSSILA